MNNLGFSVPTRLLSQGGNLSLSTLKVYLQLCLTAGLDSEGVSISSASLAKTTGISQRTVFKALAQLVDRGLITRDNDKPTAVNRYRVVTGDRQVEGAAVPACGPAAPQHPPAIQKSGTSVSSPMPVTDVVNRPPTNISASSLDDLIAMVYTAKCHVADLEKYLDMGDQELRKCLLLLKLNGGVDEHLPVDFFASALYGMSLRLRGHDRLISFPTMP